MTKPAVILIFFGLFFVGCTRTNNPANSGNSSNAVVTDSPVYGRTGDSGVRFYGEKIKFSINQPLRFQDFTLTYTGQRTVVSDLANREQSAQPWKQKPNYLQFTFHDFKVESEAGVQTVSWTTGTGDIGPARFSVGNRNYELELAASDKLGKLNENELVVWEK